MKLTSRRSGALCCLEMFNEVLNSPTDTTSTLGKAVAPCCP